MDAGATAGEPLPLLLNEAAGRGGNVEQLERTFRDAGLDPRVEVLEADGLAERLRALAGSPWVAVAGGDGTMQTAAAALRGSRTVLVPIPAGHLNHFARRLGLDTAAAAAAAAASGHTRDAPVGVLRGPDERVFLNTAVVGAYPAVVRLRERMRGVIGIWPAATVAGLWVWARWPRFDLTIRTADRELRRNTAMVWIGTGPGSFPAPHERGVAEPGEGLELVILPSDRRRHATRLFRSLWARKHGDGPETVGLEVLTAPEVEIDSRHHVHLTLDAEPITVTPPVRIALEERALRVVHAPSPS